MLIMGEALIVSLNKVISIGYFKNPFINVIYIGDRDYQTIGPVRSCILYIFLDNFIIVEV